MGLLREIQDAAVDSQTDILVVLRKCRVLASRLGHEEFKKWVQCELDGYPKDEKLPDYRILQCQSQGHFSGPFGSGMKNAPIPLNYLPKKLHPHLTVVKFVESIASLSELVKSDKSEALRSTWPADALPLVADKFYENMVLVQAWKTISRAAVVGIIETVRNRVLNFALELEAAAPDAGEGSPRTKPVAEEKVSQVFNIQIMGSVGNLASGSSHFSQKSTLEITTGDFDSLRAYLKSVDVERDDIAELERAIKADPKPEPGKGLGKKVGEWIGKMVAKSAQGIWTVSTSAAGKVLADAISIYYGWK